MTLLNINDNIYDSYVISYFISLFEDGPSMGLIDRLISLFSFSVSPENLVRKGRSLAAKGEYMAAVEQFKKALAEDPLYIPAYDGLGKAYFRLDFRKEADREFAIADGLERLRIEPDDVEAAVKMGRAMMDKGLHRLAVGYLDPLAKKHPRNPDLLKTAGLLHRGMSNDKRALELLRAGVKLMPRDPEFYLYLGVLETKVGNKEDGERLTNISRLMGRIQSDPMDAVGRYELGRHFYDRELYSDAAEYLRQALGLDRVKLDYWLFLGECYQKAGLYPAAMDAYKQASKYHPSDPRPHKSMAQVNQFMGKFEEARTSKQAASILEAGRSEQQTPQQVAKFVKYLLSIGQNDEARASLNTNLSKWPDSLELLLIHGRLLVKDANYMEAIHILRQVVEQKESLAEPHIWMAVAYQRLGESMQALAEGQLATRLAPKSHAIHRLYGDILREQKKFGMAENAYETAEHLKPSKKAK